MGIGNEMHYNTKLKNPGNTFRSQKGEPINADNWNEMPLTTQRTEMAGRNKKSGPVVRIMNAKYYVNTGDMGTYRSDTRAETRAVKGQHNSPHHANPQNEPIQRWASGVTKVIHDAP